MGSKRGVGGRERESSEILACPGVLGQESPGVLGQESPGVLGTFLFSLNIRETVKQAPLCCSCPLSDGGPQD